jgi:iron complex transport system permease protein
MIFWMIGDIANIEFSLIPWYILIISLIFTLSKARAINTMSLFGNIAYTLGISVNTLRLNLFIITSLLTATTVSNVGSIGFIGLIIPHACRFIWKEDHRLLIPFSTLIGGIFLVWADTLARTLFAPQQIPVGVITALIGAPIFLIQLYHIRRHAITSR